MSRDKNPGKHSAPVQARRRRRWWKIPVWIVIIAAAAFIIPCAVNMGVSLHLRHYISSFEPVDYSGVDRVIPEIDQETGYYTFTTDRDLKIMMLTDIHLGGGFWSYADLTEEGCKILGFPPYQDLRDLRSKIDALAKDLLQKDGLIVTHGQKGRANKSGIRIQRYRQPEGYQTRLEDVG
jgi:hypothetical protein